MANNSPSKDIIKSIEESTAKQIAANAAAGELIAERNQAAIMEAQAANDANAVMVNQTLRQGFDETNKNLYRIQGAIADMSDALCDRLDVIHGILDNPLMTQARELYRLAVIELSKGFFEEGRDYLKQALEKNKTDYLSWYLLGMVYLFGKGKYSNVINFDDAISALTNAAKYIDPDIQEDPDAKELAANILRYLGSAKLQRREELYAAGKTDDERTLLAGARKAYEGALAYSGNEKMSLIARYNIARCKALLGDTNGVVANLGYLIDEDAAYYRMAAKESDFDAIRGDFNLLIEKMRTDYYRKAKDLSDGIQSVYAKAQANGLTKKFPPGKIEEIDRLVSKGISANLPYLDMRERSESCSSLLTSLNITVHEAADAEELRLKHIARDEQYRLQQIADAKERRRKHRGHITLWVVLYLIVSIALIGGGLALVFSGSSGGAGVMLLFFPVFGGLAGYSVGDDHHPVFGVIAGIAAAAVWLGLFFGNQTVGMIFFGILWAVGGVLLTRIKTRNDDGYGKNIKN
jgi:tetratricopeptide (TPR) repeat protein